MIIVIYLLFKKLNISIFPIHNTTIFYLLIAMNLLKRHDVLGRIATNLTNRRDVLGFNIHQCTFVMKKEYVVES
jgi:hypothetical protein